MEDRFKFRAWNIKDKEMIYNIDLISADFDYNPHIIPMQCTGLKDKKGKLIYEGDIVKTKDKINSCVRYNPETFNLGFWEYFNKHYFEVGHLDSKDQCELYELEVIGNIYENPELIKGD